MHTNKYIEYLNQQQQAWCTDKYKNAHIQAVTIGTIHMTQMHTNKYIEYLNQQQQQAWCIDKCKNAHIKVVACKSFLEIANLPLR